MSRLYFITISVLSAFTLHSQDWVFQNPFSSVGTLRDIYITPNGQGWAVGDNGSILSTQDFGEIWEDNLTSPTTAAIRKILVPNGFNNEVILTASQSIHRSEDGGKTWSFVSGSSGVSEIKQIEDGTIFRSTIQNGIAKSNDGGKTWTDLNVPGSFFRGFHFINQDVGFVVQTSGEDKIIRTQDGGQNWDTLNLQLDFPNLITFADDNTGYITTNSGLLKSIDGGATWALLSNSPEGGTDIELYGDTFIWINWGLGYQYSQDGGLTWSEQGKPPFRGDPEGIHILDLSNIWITGKDVSIGFTQNSGQNWEDQIPGSKSALSGISMYNKEIGFASSFSSSILKTENGGGSWDEINYDGDHVFETIEVINDSTIILGARGGIFISNNGGLSISELAPNLGWVTKIQKLNENEIAVFGFSGMIYRISIAGEIMQEFQLPENVIEGGYFNNESNGWAVNRNGQVYNTIDGGVSWQLAFIDNEQLENVHFINEQHGFIIRRFSDTLLHTKDGGISWNKIHLPTSTFWGNMSFVDDKLGYLVGGTSTAGHVLITEDGGLTWKNDLRTSNGISDVSIPNKDEKLVWISGSGGLIARFSNCSKPPVLNQFTETNLCDNDTSTISIDFKDVDIFKWFVPDGWILVGNDNSSSISLDPTTSNGVLKVVGSNSCGDVSDTLTIELNVSPNPTPQLLLENDTLISSIQADEYLWYLDGMLIETTTSGKYFPIITGNYSLRTMNTDACTSQRSNTVFIEIVTNLSDVEYLNEIKIFPNPAITEYIFLDTKVDFYQITIVDLTGNILLTHNTTNNKINVSSIKPGLYFLTLFSIENQKITRQFLKL